MADLILKQILTVELYVSFLITIISLILQAEANQVKFCLVTVSWQHSINSTAVMVKSRDLAFFQRAGHEVLS